MTQHVVIVGAFVDSVVNFRGDLIRSLVARGHRVTAMSSSASVSQVQAIVNLGAEFVPYHVQRNGLSVSSDLATLRELRAKFRDLKPDTVIAYTIKPIIWGGLALRSVPHSHFYPMITGLGYAFHGVSIKRRFVRWLAIVLYTVALRRAKLVFFQNSDNVATFEDLGIISDQATLTLGGSGVNLEYFSQADMPKSEITFLLIARLLGDKGIREFVAAAKQVKSKFPTAQFQLAGMLDTSPDRIGEDELQRWIDECAIDFLGELKDVRASLASCHVFVLPSYHEGMPRTVLEAMATGRTIITTNAPGCRETVVDGVNGFLVDPGSVDQLVERMSWCIGNGHALDSMGVAGRRMAEERFCVQQINQAMIDVIEARSPCSKKPSGEER